MRRKTPAVALLIGLLLVGISLLLTLIRSRQQSAAVIRHWSPEELQIRARVAQAVIINLCVFAVRGFGTLFAILTAAGSISSEIEQGLLTVIFPKPLRRASILFGKWLGLCAVLVVTVLFWTFLVWLSLRLQTGDPLWGLLHAAPYLALFSVLAATLTLALSAFTPRLLGAGMALAVTGISWMDGILNGLGERFEVATLHTMAVAVGLLMPQGVVAWWVEGALQNQLELPVGPSSIGTSPRPLLAWATAAPHIAHAETLYFIAYLAVVFLVGAWMLERRDV